MVGQFLTSGDSGSQYIILFRVPTEADGRLNLTTSAFKQLGQYSSIPGRRGYCYAELAVFFPIAVAVTIASTHCAYPRRDGQAELAWVAGYVVR